MLNDFFQDEDPETSWMLIQENDLIAVFSQFPFDAMFKHLLKMDPNIPSKPDYKFYSNCSATSSSSGEHAMYH